MYMKYYEWGKIEIKFMDGMLQLLLVGLPSMKKKYYHFLKSTCIHYFFLQEDIVNNLVFSPEIQ